jgi:hypothetical protein
VATKPLKEIIAEEYQKCAKDPIHFIKKYCKIVHQERGLIPFMLYDFQENILAAYLKNGRNIILKNRQMGLSTLCGAYALWLMTFHENKYVLVIATKQDVAKNIIKKVRTMWQHLPSWMKQKCTEDNKLAQAYENGSMIYAGTSASDSGRSEAAALLIIDEGAFIEGMEELWGALQPIVSTGGDIIVLSTPNGVGNWYHQTFMNAEEGKNKFFPITLHWTLHPERDQVWRDAQDIELGVRLAKQECDGSFLASGDNVVSPEIIEYYNQTFIEDPIQKTGVDNNVWIWGHPDYTRVYLLVGDVGRGDAEDYSAFHILDLETLSQVAEYQGKISTADFGNLIVEYGTKYNDALVVVENNGIGWAVIQKILDRAYKNLFYTEQKINVVDESKMHKINNRLHRLEMKSVPGFTTNMATRPAIISKMVEFFDDRSVIIKSKRLLNELRTFIYKDGKPQAASKNYHDDLVMALAILLWVRDTALRLQGIRTALTKKALDSIKVDRTSAIYQHIQQGHINPWRMRVNEEEIDLTQFL